LAQDVATAEALFNRGFADMDAGRYETGCKAIAASQRLDPRAGTLFTLAVCEAQWGKIATAASHYDGGNAAARAGGRGGLSAWSVVGADLLQTGSPSLLAVACSRSGSSWCYSVQL
jgi:hypothetical protein